MKPLILILAICSLGYVVDHWQELANRYHGQPVADTHGLIIYGTKSCGAWIKLDNELNKRGVPHQKKDLGDEANFHELTDKLARVGKMGGSIPMPVAEIDGVLVEGATLNDISRRMH